MTVRPRRSHSWPLLELWSIGGEKTVIRAGAIGRGRYVAIDECGQPMTFGYLQLAVTCPRCEREYAVTKVEKT